MDLNVRLVAELTVNVGAFVAPNRTAVTPVKALPVTVTTVPTGPLLGEKFST